MSYSADYINSATRPVLELLREVDIPLSYSTLHYNFQHWDRWSSIENVPSKATVDRALKGLRKYELVDRPESKYYKINDRGRAFLDGDLSADELDP